MAVSTLRRRPLQEGTGERHLVGVFDPLEDAGAGVQREAEHDRDVHDAQEFIPVAVNAGKWAKSAVHGISESGIDLLAN
jgi:hypothetical protein